MPREKKVKAVEDLNGLVSRCSIGILTNYRGISAAEMAALRRQLRGAGIDYKVVKNTLARFAVERAGRDELLSLFKGPVAIAFGYGDITGPARVFDEYIRGSKTTLSVKGGFIADRVLSAEEVNSLSKLPSREVLVGKVLGGMQMPIVGLLNSLNAPLRGLMGVLQARIQQMEAK
jgi:large subunit ribosomal protein L10